MSAPLSPPPTNEAGAITQPRQLQRWLDVNRVTHLTRTQAYITLPAFSVNTTWQGYSDIVAAFNFEGPNNFSLRGFSGIEPTDIPNYLLCIMWRDSSGNVYRYKLWSGVGEVVYFDIPVYSGQKIAKNFRFEVWSTNSTPAVQATPISIYTSVLGNVDYRYGSDFLLVSGDGIVTDFNASVVDTGLTPPTPLNQFRADSGVDGSGWTPTNTGYVTDKLSNSGAITTSTDSNIQGQKYITNLHVATSLSLVSGVNPDGIAFLFKYVEDGDIILIGTDSGNNVLSIADGLFTVDGNSVSPSVAIESGNWYFVQWSYLSGNSIVAAWSLDEKLTSSNFLFSGIAISNSRANSSDIIVGYGITFGIAELLIYDHPLISGFLVDYTNDRYVNLFAVPITFPDNSSPQPNI